MKLVPTPARLVETDALRCVVLVRSGEALAQAEALARETSLDSDTSTALRAECSPAVRAISPAPYAPRFATRLAHHERARAPPLLRSITLKRPFERSEAMLVDDYVDEHRNKYHERLPDPDALDPDQREALLERLAQGAPVPMPSLDGPQHDPHDVEAILAGLHRGAVPSLATLQGLDDPRVRLAILAAAKRIDLVEHCVADSVLRVLGIIGGEEARGMLHSTIDALLEHPSTWNDAAHWNDHASRLEAACRYLLGLDPDATFAANAMIRLLEHPCAFNREQVVRSIAAVVDRPECPRTEAFERLRKALLPMLDADITRFLYAASVLIREVGKPAIARCEETVRSGPSHHQVTALNTLSKIPCLPWSDRDRILAIEAIRNARSLHGAHQLCMFVGPFLPPDVLESLIRRSLAHESPSLRYKAAAMLRRLPVRVARELADEARSNEPDPVIRSLLDRLRIPD